MRLIPYKSWYMYTRFLLSLYHSRLNPSSDYRPSFKLTACAEMATKVLHSRQEFEDAVSLVLTISASTSSADGEIDSDQCAIFDFSDKDCPYKQKQIAFDRFTAERGVPAFRIDPTLAGVSLIES
jgi:hypothetical protein